MRGSPLEKTSRDHGTARFSLVSNIFRVTVFAGTQASKLNFVFNCGCQTNDLHSWLVQSVIAPWSWFKTANGSTYLGGPYSFLWYWLNTPARYGFVPWMFYLLAVDTAITGFVFKSQNWLMLVPYTYSTLYFLQIDPIDTFTFWLSIGPLLYKFGQWWLGIVLPILAALIKIPLGAPGYVWNYVMNNPYGIHEPGGVWRYVMVGSWWLAGVAVIFYTVYRQRKARESPSVNIETLCKL